MTDQQRLTGNHALVASLIDHGSKVLDIGCHQGDLLAHLQTHNHVDGRGIEIDPAGVHACLKRGLSVIQGDADTDLSSYPDKIFDYSILSQTLQSLQRPKDALEHVVRIAKTGIVVVPNFGYWRVRAGLALGGRMPVNKMLSYSWYDTPNIHFCTVTDFIILCNKLNIDIKSMIFLGEKGEKLPIQPGKWIGNWSAAQALFMLERSLE